MRRTAVRTLLLFATASWLAACDEMLPPAPEKPVPVAVKPVKKAPVVAAPVKKKPVVDFGDGGGGGGWGG